MSSYPPEPFRIKVTESGTIHEFKTNKRMPVFHSFIRENIRGRFDRRQNETHPRKQSPRKAHC